MTLSRVDLEHPSVARVYDFLLDGCANWAIDRVFGHRILREFPELKDIALANRMFVNRAVRFLTRIGVRQFIDIGCGVLSEGNTHQVADEVAPDCRVVYVDKEPIAVAHGEVLLDEAGDRDRQAIVHADLRDPDELWGRVWKTGVLDAEAPVAVLLCAVLSLIPPEPGDADPVARSVAGYRELLPSGSYLGISHLTSEGIPAELGPKIGRLNALAEKRGTPKVYCRSRSEIDGLLGDFERIGPGMVWTPEWHPEEERPARRPIRFDCPSQAAMLAGVGRKP